MTVTWADFIAAQHESSEVHNNEIVTWMITPFNGNWLVTSMFQESEWKNDYIIITNKQQNLLYYCTVRVCNTMLQEKLHYQKPFNKKYWCYDHWNRNRFFNWKSNRIEIVFFVHPVKRFVHSSIGSLIDAVVALQKTDHSLQRGRSVVFKLFICRPRPPLGWSEREVRGRTGVNCSSPANKAHVQI